MTHQLVEHFTLQPLQSENLNAVNTVDHWSMSNQYVKRPYYISDELWWGTMSYDEVWFWYDERRRFYIGCEVTYEVMLNQDGNVTSPTYS